MIFMSAEEGEANPSCALEHEVQHLQPTQYWYYIRQNTKGYLDVECRTLMAMS